MTVLDEIIALRDTYLSKHGLNITDFGLNFQFPPIPSNMWEWYKDFKFGTKQIYKRPGQFFIYLNVDGEPYEENGIPYGVVRFLAPPVGVPEGEEAPKMLSQWGRRSEIHFEPMRDGTAWESIPHGSRVIHCESLIKAKAVHKATGLPCIGYNGVNGFSSAKLGVELIHTFANFAFDKMDNIILYDSDVLTNSRVIAARESLSHKLRHVMNAAMVKWATLPQRVVEGGPPQNWGPDDFLLEHGAAALMQIIDAAVPYQDEEFSSLVEEMNERVRWVRSQAAVFDRGRRSLVRWNEAVLSHRNVNRTVVNKNTKKVVYGTDVWLQSKHRLEVDSVGYRYLDGEFFQRNGETFANEYLPDGAQPGADGMLPNSIVHQMLVRLFSAHDLELVRSYLRFLKFSGDKPTSYCILWSDTRGIGKGWFTELARALLGKRHVATATADSLAEKFNLHTVNCRLVIAHEFQASSSANKKLALNYLKTFVGDETIMVRAMNRNPYQAEVRAGLFITVNNKSDMPSDGLGDRRQWYVEGGAGARELGLEIWGPEAPEWDAVYQALNDPDEMSRVAHWVEHAKWVDFKSWRPPMTEERVESLVEGLSPAAQAAHEVLRDAIEAGVRATDAKAIRALMMQKLDGQEIYLVGKAFGKCLKEAGWWTDRKYERATEAKSSAWFPGPSTLNVSDVSAIIREDAKKWLGKY